MSAEQQRMPTRLSREERINIATSELARFVDMGVDLKKLGLEVDRVVNRAAMFTTPEAIIRSVQRQLSQRMDALGEGYPVAKVVSTSNADPSLPHAIPVHEDTPEAKRKRSPQQ